MIRAVAASLFLAVGRPALAQASALLADGRYNQVELQAEASREVQNDVMTVNLYAEASDPSAAKVADQLNRVTAEALKAAGAAAARSGWSRRTRRRSAARPSRSAASA